MRRGPALALVAVVMAIGAQSPHAAKVQVAGPTAKGATIRAFHRHAKLCLDLVVEYESIGTSCQDTPRLPRETEFVDDFGVTAQGFLGGATTSDIVRVQAVQLDGATTDAAVVQRPKNYP